MNKLARDLMTPNPACCAPHTTIDEVAKMMAQFDCGEIPVLDSSHRPIGVVTDRDIVCRIVAKGLNPPEHTADSCMTQPVVTVQEQDSVDSVTATMERHRVRRVPVIDDSGACVGIIAQADVAREEPWKEVAALVREVSVDDSRVSR